MYTLNISEPAEEDITETLDYIHNILKAPEAAKKLFYQLEEKLKNIQEFPSSCQIVNDKYLSTKGIRFYQIDNFLIFYIVDETEKIITIIRFLYARRDWTNILKVNTEN